MLALAGAGCAASNGPPPTPDTCASDRTLVCAYRMGKPYRCSCQSKDVLSEIFHEEVY